MPQDPRGIAGADHHADRARRGRRSHSRPRDGRRRLSRQAVQSARTAGPDQCRAAPAGRRADRQRRQWRDRADLSGLADRFPAARVAQSGRRAGRDDQRRIRPAAHLLRAAGPRAVARQPARSDPGAQRRLVRAQHRRAGQPHPAQDRTRSAGRHHDQDRALRRLYVHPDGGCDRGRHRRQRHEAARFSEPEEHQRTDRGAGDRLDRRHPPDPDRHLSDPPAGPARSVDRPRSRPVCRGGATARRGVPGRTAAAARRHRARVSAARHRSLPPGPVPAASDPEGLDLRSLHRTARQQLPDFSARP